MATMKAMQIGFRRRTADSEQHLGVDVPVQQRSVRQQIGLTLRQRAGRGFEHRTDPRITRLVLEPRRKILERPALVLTDDAREHHEVERKTATDGHDAPERVCTDVDLRVGQRPPPSPSTVMRCARSRCASVVRHRRNDDTSDGERLRSHTLLQIGEVDPGGHDVPHPRGTISAARRRASPASSTITVVPRAGDLQLSRAGGRQLVGQRTDSRARPACAAGRRWGRRGGRSDSGFAQLHREHGVPADQCGGEGALPGARQPGENQDIRRRYRGQQRFSTDLRAGSVPRSMRHLDVHSGSLAVEHARRLAPAFRFASPRRRAPGRCLRRADHPPVVDRDGSSRRP